jgi:hypothetical protein
MKAKKYVSAKTIQKYKINPWVSELEYLATANKAIGFSTKKMIVTNPETGEYDGDSRMMISKKTDSENFVKIFEAGLKSMQTLSPSALMLQIYIVRILCSTNTKKHSSDTIYLNYSALQYDYDYCFSNSTFTSARNELTIKQFIAPIENKNYLFYLNPKMFFKGNRLSLL